MTRIFHTPDVQRYTEGLRQRAPGLRLRFRTDDGTQEAILELSTAINSEARISEESIYLANHDVIGEHLDEQIRQIQDSAITALGLGERVEVLAQQKAEEIYRDRVEKLRAAWNDPGEHPEYHYEQKGLLFRRWETLATELHRLFG